MSGSLKSLVCPGEVVLHKPGVHSTTWAGMYVTDVFDSNVSGVMMEALTRPGPSQQRLNVVHASDPRTTDPHFIHRMNEEGDQGVFVLNPTRLRMEGAIAALVERVESLESLLKNHGIMKGPKGKRKTEEEPQDSAEQSAA